MIAGNTLSATVYSEAEMDEVEATSLGCGLAVVSSTRSPAKITPNEDTAALIPVNDRAAVLAVADGLGGVRNGQLAASIAVEALCAALSEAADADDLRTPILNGIERANREVQRKGIGSATTLAVIEIRDRVIRPYHVGDSMILVTGQRGKVKLQTVSHSPIGFAVESGFLDEREAMHHEDRHLVSNYVGSQEMRIEIGAPLILAPRDTLLLASDGLFDNLHIPEIVERTRKGPLDTAVRKLVSDATARMKRPANGRPSKPDDLTVVAFRLGTAKRRQCRHSS